MTRQKLDLAMGMIPLIKEKSYKNGEKLLEYKSFLIVIDQNNQVKNWIYTHDDTTQTVYLESYSTFKPKKVEDAYIVPSKNNDKNKFFVHENVSLLKKLLNNSGLKLVKKPTKGAIRIEYNSSIGEPEIETKVVSTPKYRLNYVPGQTATYTYSGNTNTNYNFSGYGSYGYANIYGNAQSTTTGYGTVSTPGYLTSEYAGQDIRTYNIKRYTKKLSIKAYKGKEMLFSSNLSLTSTSQNLRISQKILLNALYNNGLISNSTEKKYVGFYNTFNMDFLGLEVPSVEPTISEIKRNCKKYPSKSCASRGISSK